MKTSTLARWKVKYQRATGYIALGTFVIVLYGLIRDLHASPFFPLKLPFWAIVVLFFGVAILGIPILAELDWRYIFKREQAQTILKNPLLYATIFQSAWLLVHHDTDIKELEGRLREVYRGIGVEEEFDDLLSRLKK